ncbi:hypothetical protein GW17_00012338 [Ensete ventricosum]|nr:hypothetical protein GW17_00012338 [Ensete ventricosum]
MDENGASEVGETKDKCEEELDHHVICTMGGDIEEDEVGGNEDSPGGKGIKRLLLNGGFVSHDGLTMVRLLGLRSFGLDPSPREITRTGPVSGEGSGGGGGEKGWLIRFFDSAFSASGSP